MTQYVALCALAELPSNGSRGFRRDGVALFCVTRGERIYLYRNRCPHFGLSLEWLPDRFLTSRGDQILCARHGARFRIEDGACTQGPCQGQALEPLGYELRDGTLFVRL